MKREKKDYFIDFRFVAYARACSEFQCKNSKQCIPKAWVCDGSVDCGVDDDTDEAADCSMYSSLSLIHPQK